MNRAIKYCNYRNLEQLLCVYDDLFVCIVKTNQLKIHWKIVTFNISRMKYVSAWNFRYKCRFVFTLIVQCGASDDFIKMATTASVDVQ